ncbi:MAG TPA: archease [Solirubrobacteraceae bacterium]|nr:archease [Solirubrobacteraceae bacterium]
MAWRWVEHTGELELEAEAPTPEAVFAEGLAAMAELLGQEGDAVAGRARETRELHLSGRDRAVLFADWLAELAVLAETEGFVVDEARRIELGGDAVRATVLGHRGQPPHLVKAVTLHRLLFAHDDRGWRARATLDV